VRYEAQGGRVSDGGRLGTMWWRQIVEICRGRDVGG